MKLPLKFSNHAKEKMDIRQVSESEVSWTITAPDNIYKDVGHGTIVAVKKVRNNSIIVVYIKEGDGAKVITLFRTTKLDKLAKTKTARGTWKKVK